MADAAAEPEPDTRPKLSLGILKIIKAAQAANGLRHSDFQRYRQYCSRRLHRVRKSVAFTNGKKRYKPQRLTSETVEDERFLLIPLITAERAWGYAMQLKFEMVDAPRKRFHMLKRLAAAARAAHDLRKLVQIRGDEATVLEAEAYASFMLGSVLLEKERFSQAQGMLGKAQKIYTELSRMQEDDEQRKLFLLFANDELNPSILFCKYNMNKFGDKQDDEVDDALKQLLESSEGESSTLDALKAKLRLAIDIDEQEVVEEKDVVWRGVTLSVASVALRVAISSAEKALEDATAEESLDKKFDRYGKVVMAFSEALTQVQREQQEARSEGSADADLEVLSQLEVYLNSQKITAGIERNLALSQTYRARLVVGERERVSARGESGASSKAVKPEEVVGIYDKLIANISEMLQLPGIDEADEERAHLSARLLCFKALRCVYLGESFRAQKGWAEAYVLYERAAEHADSAARRHKKSEPADSAAIASKARDLKELKVLLAIIDGLRPLVHAEAFLQTQTEAQPEPEKSKATSVGDWSSEAMLNTYARPTTLAALPPRLEGMPCKPVLFDLAEREMSFPLESLKQKGASKTWGQAASSVWAMAPKISTGGWFGRS